MFTGIVQAVGSVRQAVPADGQITLMLQPPTGFADGILPGASVSVSGVCLTFTRFDGKDIVFDVMDETCEKTTLGTVAVGERVHLERAARLGDEIGGHSLSGHVHTVARVSKKQIDGENVRMYFAIAPKFLRYVFAKGYIALNGVSLTVIDVDEKNAAFSVGFIPETLARTTFATIDVGDSVNVEFEQQTVTIVDSVERVLARRR